jgi:putative FmdB family regulatory protein
MPIFDYKCNECGFEFEVLVRSSEQNINCEKCNSNQVEKMLSTFSVSVNSTQNKVCDKSSNCCPMGGCCH